MTYKVIQWTTGKVGVEAVKAILTHPELELVGAYAWSVERPNGPFQIRTDHNSCYPEAKNGRDAIFLLRCINS